MPRDLTDLMEAAVSTAPPERHLPGDITRLAERRQRRRTTLIAGGAAMAVIVVAGATVGLTQGRASRPEPAAPFLHDRTVNAKSAVPAASVPGYRVEPWTVPSIQHAGAGYADVPTYREVDGQGRLIVVTYQGPRHVATPQLFEGPGQPESPLPQLADPGSNGGTPGAWVPSFQADDRLLWTRSVPVFGKRIGIHLTDLDGGNDVFVPTHFQDGSQDVSTDQPWVWGDRLWFTSWDSGSLHHGASHSLYTATFAGDLTKVADHVAVADVADGVAAWVTTDGRLLTESASGGSPHAVQVPLSPGCRMPSTEAIQSESGSRYLAVDGSVVALTEICGGARTPRPELLAFDLAGHRLVHVTGVYAVSPSLGDGAVVFTGVGTPGVNGYYRYDLRTGRLALVGDDAGTPDLGPAQTAGDYVLWYDKQGGHVGHFGP